MNHNTTAAPALLVRNLDKRYGDLRVARNISFALGHGDIGCLMGPSGCGKTTLLRVLAGFEGIAAGRVEINGAPVTSPSTLVPPEKRGIGMVFQDYALFPHLTALENISFGLFRVNASVRRSRAQELLELVGLAAEGLRYPHELSGGQQQRVALARALAPEPELLLLDEPFSNLDVGLREKLSLEVRRIIKQTSTTALMVTHNHREAFAMADVAGIMFEGELVQWDAPPALYHRPRTLQAAAFLGEGSLIPGIVNSDGGVECGLGVLQPPEEKKYPTGTKVHVLVRPEDVLHQDNAPVTALIEDMTFQGANVLFTLRLDSGDRIHSLASSHHLHRSGERIGIVTAFEEVILFSENEAECASPEGIETCLADDRQ